MVNFLALYYLFTTYLKKYVVKHAKLLTHDVCCFVGKLEAALNISHLILSTSSQRVS